MPRSRVLSFMSQWGGAPRSPSPEAELSSEKPTPAQSTDSVRKPPPAGIDTITPQSSALRLDASLEKTPDSPSTPSRARADLKPKRPASMSMVYNPPQIEVASDTPPELQPIFTFLNSHSNKLYQEGYFLKLHDLDTRGKPSVDRVWNECFAQLVGTVLSLWDANALDVAGEDDEVVPTFINLSDASIKMIEALPMNGAQGGQLQNVLSLSTAANNRYLLHFNTLSSLTQWTAAIRLAMFEHTSLQEAYTGSLIAGKGRHLNNIRQIMFRLQFPYSDWARVRFGAGTPWRRCWVVVAPPDEKEYKKAQSTQKKSPYERVKTPKGDIKFYDTKKVTKKTKPIATISDAFAAYAIYPQSKPLIEQSTLLKMEGLLTVHGSQETTNEGFVFIMPEVHAAVTGFEILLRFMFPVYDAFALYGRPNKLVADTLDQRGLMFALPRDRRYGYLDILDVSGLIHTKGSERWSERQWRREMKKLTASRMTNQPESSPYGSRAESRRRAGTGSRTSLPGTRGVRFDGEEMAHSTPGSRSVSPGQGENRSPVPRTDSAPPGAMSPMSHKRSVSEAQGYRKYMSETPSRLSQEASRPGIPNGAAPPPPPPKHGGVLGAAISKVVGQRSVGPGTLERIQSESEVPTVPNRHEWDGMSGNTANPLLAPPAPVGPPPAFAHSPNSRPANEPFASPELRRANSSVDAATLRQMQEATRRDRSPDDRSPDEEWEGEVQERQQNTVASQSFANRNLGVPADRSQAALNRKPRDPRQRLSTIPGSPYVGDNGDYFHSPEQTTLPQLDGVVEEAPPPPPPPHEPTQPIRPAPPVPIHSSKSIARKPVPRTSPSTPSDERPPLPRSISDPNASPVTDSWEGSVIDDAALERILNQDTLERTKTVTTQSSEPDYASTTSAASMKQKVSIDKPRAGKLKTVGDPGFQPAEQRAATPSGIPDVDFGRTYALDPAVNPDSRPGTRGRMTPGELADKRRSRSADRLGETSRDLAGMLDNTPRATPTEAARLSYFGGRNTPSPGRSTPEQHPGAVAWQPSAPLHRSKTSMSPEEWVQQKAAMSHQPQYAPPRKVTPERYNTAHGRSNSAMGMMRKLTKTPPFARNSGDWAKEAGHRSPPPPRPQSRGAGINLDSAGQSLSAQEQMKVSRATGTPLLDLAQNPKQQQLAEQQPGMVGYVQQRERDKAALKEGRNSMFVQQAIAERQQQQMRVEMEAQAHREYQMQLHLQAQQQQVAQQMQYNQSLMGQNQPVYQQQQQQQQRQPWEYEQMGNYQQAYSRTNDYGSTAGYAQQQAQASSNQTTPAQAYGASYFAKEQQRQQQYGRQ